MSFNNYLNRDLNKRKSILSRNSKFVEYLRKELETNDDSFIQACLEIYMLSNKVIFEKGLEGVKESLILYPDSPTFLKAKKLYENNPKFVDILNHAENKNSVGEVLRIALDELFTDMENEHAGTYFMKTPKLVHSKLFFKHGDPVRKIAIVNRTLDIFCNFIRHFIYFKVQTLAERKDLLIKKGFNLTIKEGDDKRQSIFCYIKDEFQNADIPLTEFQTSILEKRGLEYQSISILESPFEPKDPQNKEEIWKKNLSYLHGHIFGGPIHLLLRHGILKKPEAFNLPPISTTKIKANILSNAILLTSIGMSILNERGMLTEKLKTDIKRVSAIASDCINKAIREFKRAFLIPLGNGPISKNILDEEDIFETYDVMDLEGNLKKQNDEFEELLKIIQKDDKLKNQIQTNVFSQAVSGSSLLLPSQVKNQEEKKVELSVKKPQLTIQAPTMVEIPNQSISGKSRISNLSSISSGLDIIEKYEKLPEIQMNEDLEFVDGYIKKGKVFLITNQKERVEVNPQDAFQISKRNLTETGFFNVLKYFIKEYFSEEIEKDIEKSIEKENQLKNQINQIKEAAKEKEEKKELIKETPKILNLNEVKPNEIQKQDKPSVTSFLTFSKPPVQQSETKGFDFGTKPIEQKGFNFGTQAPPQVKGFNFGQNSSSQQINLTPNIQNPITTSLPQGFNFGTTNKIEDDIISTSSFRSEGGSVRSKKIEKLVKETFLKYLNLNISTSDFGKFYYKILEELDEKYENPEVIITKHSSHFNFFDCDLDGLKIIVKKQYNLSKYLMAAISVALSSFDPSEEEEEFFRKYLLGQSKRLMNMNDDYDPRTCYSEETFSLEVALAQQKKIINKIFNKEKLERNEDIDFSIQGLEEDQKSQISSGDNFLTRAFNSILS